MAVPPGVVLVTFATVAGMAAVAGVVILAANPRHPWNRRLGAYLLVEAVSFGGYALAQVPDLPAPAFVAVSRVAAAAGPALLVAFAAVFPRRAWWPGMTPTFAAAAGGVAVLTLREGPTPVLSAYTVTAYMAASVMLVLATRRETSEIVARQARVLTPGVLAITLPWVAVEVARGVEAAGASDAVAAVVWVMVVWGLYLLLARGLGHWGRLLGWALLVLTALWVFGHAGGRGDVAALLTLEVRWFILAAALGYGIIRFQALAVTPRRWGATVATAAGLAIFGTAAATGTVLGPIAAAAVAAGLGVAAAVVVGRVGREAPVLAHHRLDAYRSLLASRLSQGTPFDGPDVADAARRLGVTRREHDLLVATVEAEDAGRGGGSRGRYQVVRRLGAGGQAVVDLARDVETGRSVVLKRYHDAGGLRHAAAARAVAHPNLVAVHDVLTLPRGGLVVMEHVDGPNLQEVVEAEGALPADRVDGIARGLLRGLAALHDAGMAHGDVKPENVLLAEHVVKLADLGASGPAGGGDTLPAAGLTPAYAAPERRGGGPPSPVDDVYAAGRTIHEALTFGARPYENLPDGAQSHWGPVLERALADDPTERWRDAAAMLAAWEAASS